MEVDPPVIRRDGRIGANLRLLCWIVNKGVGLKIQRFGAELAVEEEEVARPWGGVGMGVSVEEEVARPCA